MSAAAPGCAGAGTTVRAGHLRKLKTMKKKYFVLRAESADRSARLEYYESEKKWRAGGAPRRVIPLSACYNITRRLDLKQRHVIALFTRDEQFCIVAEDEQDLHAWLSAILRHHRSEDNSDDLLHPIQHVWQVNVQKKGLGATKNIQGLYNLCLTDKTLTLVKIKSLNNVISDLGIPERVEYSLKNIRRCGDSECFFYMEVGRQTATGAGELWMHSDDSNIAQSMHSTIYHAMRNCAKETENERDHIVIPKRPESAEGTALPPRRQTISDSRGRAGLTNAENQPPNNSLTEHKATPNRAFKHHRTISLPTGCYQEPLRISHGRTKSAPLTGDEVDKIIEKSGHKMNGMDLKSKQMSRRASTGTRLLTKLSPAHMNTGPVRSRCDSMPSRSCSSFDSDRPQQRHSELDVLDLPHDETDSEWHRAPGIPEEPDFSDLAFKDLMSWRGSVQHSRTSSLGAEEEGYLPMRPPAASASSSSVCSGTPSTDHRFSEYPLERATSHIVESERPPRAYSVGSRPAPRSEPRHRAYSVGSRSRPPHTHTHNHTDASSAPHLLLHSYMQKPRASATDLMEMDFSTNSPAAKPQLTAGTPPGSVGGGAGVGAGAGRRALDEYVDMSPRYLEMKPPAPTPTPAPDSHQPLPQPQPLPATPTTSLTAHPATAQATPDGYVEMNYGRGATRPIAITCARTAPPPIANSPDDRKRRNGKENRTPLGSQTIFPLSLDSPASPPEDTTELEDEEVPHHPLTTVREISEDGRKSPEVSSSPSYVKLVYKKEESNELSCNPLATKTLTRGDTDKVESTATVVLAGVGPPAARFSVDELTTTSTNTTTTTSSSTSSTPPAVTAAAAGTSTTVSTVSCIGPPLNYASLDLEPKKAVTAVSHRTYTQIDFARSEKLHVDGS